MNRAGANLQPIMLHWEPQVRLLPVRGKGLSHLHESLSTEQTPLFCPS
jgi:hypothetical protein